jgi:hypothetical protein
MSKVKHGWIITHDWISKGAGIGRRGPSGISPVVEAILIAGTTDDTIDMLPQSRRFRLFDADDVLYYEGIVWSPNDEGMLSPLDDYGMPNAGCVRMVIKDKKTGN